MLFQRSEEITTEATQSRPGSQLFSFSADDGGDILLELGDAQLQLLREVPQLMILLIYKQFEPQQVRIFLQTIHRTLAVSPMLCSVA